MKKPVVIAIVVIGIIVAIGAMVVSKNTSTPAAMSPSPSVAVDQNLLTPAEKKEILAAATEIVTSNTEQGYKYTLNIKKRVGDYVRVDVTPAEGEMLDPAQVILEKKDGVWKATTFGTAFPELYDKVPELFQ